MSGTTTLPWSDSRLLLLDDTGAVYSVNLEQLQPHKVAGLHGSDPAVKKMFAATNTAVTHLGAVLVKVSYSANLIV